jgi:hypothetical protein
LQIIYTKSDPTFKGNEVVLFCLLQYGMQEV